MNRMVQARLDAESQKILASLERRTGWRDSEIIRKGIRALAALIPEKKGRTIIGIGKFSSGRPDLGSNKAYLRGFGAA